MRLRNALLLALFVAGCAPQAAAPARLAAPLLLAVDGQASLDRSGLPLVPAAPGLRLEAGDVLAPRGKAIVLCPDLAIVAVTERQQPCPNVPSRMQSDGMEYVMVSRGPAPPINAPYLLSPRASLVLDPRPAIRWNDTGGNYTVELAVGARTLWKASAALTSTLAYPPSERALEEGRLYTLLIADNKTGARSDDGPALPSDFRLAPQALRSTADATRNALAAALKGYDPAVVQMASATAYLEFVDGGLRPYADAAALLERAAPALDTPPLWNRLGWVRLQMRLPNEAATAYAQGLTAAQRFGDKLGEADARAGRWRALGEQADYDAALALYDALGAKARVKALRDEITGVVPTPTP